VRFVLRPVGQSPADASLAGVIVAANYPPTDALHVAPIAIDGQRRESLVERTPGNVALHMRPRAAQPRLTFFVGLDPNGGTSASAEFSAAIEVNGQRQVLFQRTLDASRPADRHWVPGTIDLAPYIGQDVKLVLQTRSPAAPTSAPVWGDLHLAPRPDASQFKQVYAGEVSIWENTQALPRVFLIGDVQPALTTAEAIARMQAPGFDPLQTAVVENAAADRLPSGTAPPGSARTTRYGQSHVHILVEARQPALLVLTDSYFPGWHASIDGAEAPILPADVAFRGVLVPPGSHQVTFEYAPVSFSIGLALAAAALVVLAAAVWRLS
jgi:hypothetical protein